MSNSSGTMEAEDVVKGKPTLVRRVSDMLKDGNSSGPPMLFRHSSMQKIRHCCQNLNLFPYLLYSFDNSKSHPIARKVHLCFGEFLKGITARILFLYNNLRLTVHRGIRAEGLALHTSKEPAVLVKPTTPRFRTFQRGKPKQQIPLFLTMAVYFAPLLLAFQSIGLFSLMIFGKYTPGFIFLITALFLLGFISLKIVFHQTVVHNTAVQNTVMYEKNKVQ